MVHRSLGREPSASRSLINGTHHLFKLDHITFAALVDETKVRGLNESTSLAEYFALCHHNASRDTFGRLVAWESST
jgi:hypothetical protein